MINIITYLTIGIVIDTDPKIYIVLAVILAVVIFYIILNRRLK